MEQGVRNMSYQAPMLLLLTVAMLIVVYGWLYWRQKVVSIDYPCLVLLIGGQENYLEGLLRLFFLWCQRSNSLWRLQVITAKPSQSTIAILRHLFVPYSCIHTATTATPVPGTASGSQLLVAAGKGVYCLDIRGEKSFKGARQRLEHVWQQKETQEGINKPRREE
jgi:hypothetical protein